MHGKLHHALSIQKEITMGKYETVKTNKYLDAKPKSMVIEKRATNEPVQNKYFQKVISSSAPYNSMQKSAIIRKDIKKELPPWVQGIMDFLKSMAGTPEEQKQLLEMVSKYVPNIESITEHPELMTAFREKGVTGKNISNAIAERAKRGDNIQDFISMTTSSAPAASSPSRMVSETSSTASSPTTAAEIAAASSGIVPRKTISTPSAKRLALLDKLEKDPLSATEDDKRELAKILAAKYDSEHIIRAQKINSVINPTTSLPSTASTSGTIADSYLTPPPRFTIPVSERVLELLDKLESDPSSITASENYELTKITRSLYEPEIIDRAKKIKSAIDEGKTKVVSDVDTSFDPITGKIVLPTISTSRPSIVSETKIPDAGIADTTSLSPAVDAGIVTAPITAPASAPASTPVSDSVIRFDAPTESIAEMVTPFTPAAQERALQYLQNGRIFKTPASFRHKFQDVLEKPGPEGENLFNILDQGVLNGYISHEDALHLLSQAGIEDRRLDPRPSRVMGMIGGMGAARRKIGQGLSTAASRIKSATPAILNATGEGLKRTGKGINWTAENVAPIVALGALGYASVDAAGNYLNEQEKEKQLQDRMLSDYARQNAIPSVNEKGEPILVDPKTNQEIPAVDINGNKRESFIDNPMRQRIVNSKMKDTSLQYEENPYADPFTGKIDPNYKIYRENVYDPSNTRIKQEIGRFGAGQMIPGSKLSSIWDNDSGMWVGGMVGQSKKLQRIPRLSGDIWKNPDAVVKRMKKSLRKAGGIKDDAPPVPVVIPPSGGGQGGGGGLPPLTFSEKLAQTLQNPLYSGAVSGMASSIKSNALKSVFNFALENPQLLQDVLSGKSPVPYLKTKFNPNDIMTNINTQAESMDSVKNIANVVSDVIKSNVISQSDKQATINAVIKLGGTVTMTNNGQWKVSLPEHTSAIHAQKTILNAIEQRKIEEQRVKKERDIAKAPAHLQGNLRRDLNSENYIKEQKSKKEQNEMARAGGQAIQISEYDQPKTTDKNFYAPNVPVPLRSTASGFFQLSQTKPDFASFESRQKYAEQQGKKAIDMVNGKYKPKSKIEELQLTATAQKLENQRKQAIAQANAARAKAAAKAKADAEAAARRNKTKNETLTAYQMMGMNASKPTLPTMATTSSKATTAIIPPLTPSALAIQPSAPVIPIAPIIQASPYQEQAMAIAEAQRQQAINSQIMQMIANRKI